MLRLLYPSVRHAQNVSKFVEVRRSPSKFVEVIEVIEMVLKLSKCLSKLSKVVEVVEVLSK